MIDDSTRRRFVAAVVTARLAGLSGCLGGRRDRGDDPSGASGEEDGTARGTATAAAPVAVGDAARERLDDRLVGLVEAENRTAYAAASELPYEDGRVLVVVELRAGADLPPSPPVTVRNRHESLAEGYVAAADLPALATADGVAGVRPPRTPATEGASAGVGRGGA